MQRGFLEQYMSEGDRWSMPDSGLWIYPDLWWEEVRLDVSGERVGEPMGDKRAGFQCRIQRGCESADGGVPAQRCCCLNWLCFILARCSVYYSFVVYWRRASLPSHWTPLHPSQDSELSFTSLDWHLLGLLHRKGNLFYFPLIWLPWSLHSY